ncbi:glutathione S-transferase family protein [Paraglaciecola hydrolytica]|uniref:Glutathione S-transferase n=1 Tax=Paraglaciecola hydrolytica TaxID=1799789 RepID=A0A135ZZN3_9ALTE|nr:glutathione S-transferase family protein [Paraglaciecola hydrolytica]KXI28431.1 glutathione S-transferase [Paraglaciecola hydrolytica]
MLTLYGSTTSPYVRRLRIWLANTQHDFVNWKIFEKQDRAKLMAKNPTLKVPMLEDSTADEVQTIFDSRVIYRYLSEKLKHPALTWQQENQLTIIDAANDSLVQMFILAQSGIKADEDLLFFKLQKERVNGVLVYLNELVAEGQFVNWNYPAMSLFSLIDWVEFRSLHNLKGLTDLLAFHEDNAQRIEVTATDPRT